MKSYLRTLTIAAGLLAASQAQAGGQTGASLTAAEAQVAQAHVQHYGHWDVCYWYWNGFCWQKVVYNSYATKAEADHQVLHLIQAGWTAWSEYHY